MTTSRKSWFSMPQRPAHNVLRQSLAKIRRTGRGFRLADLPNELLLEIGKHLPQAKQLARLASVSRRFYTLFQVSVYRKAVEDDIWLDWNKNVPEQYDDYKMLATNEHEPRWTPRRRAQDCKIPLLNYLVLIGRLDAMRAFLRVPGAARKYLESASSPLPLVVFIGREELFFCIFADVSAIDPNHISHQSGMLKHDPTIARQALCLAAALGRLEPLRQLLRAGAEFNVGVKLDFPGRINQNPTVKGKTTLSFGYPIHWAAAYNHPKALRILLEAGANVHEINSLVGVYWNPTGNKALFYAASSSSPECVKVLLDFDAGNDQEALSSALYAAVGVADAECVDLLIKAGASTTATPGREGNPMQLAVKKNNVDCMRLLLSAGASIDTNDFDKESLTFVAARNRAFSCLKVLFEMGKRAGEVSASIGDSLLKAAAMTKIEATQEEEVDGLYPTLGVILEWWPDEERAEVDSEIDRVAIESQKARDALRVRGKARGYAKETRESMLRGAERMDKQAQFITARRHRKNT